MELSNSDVILLRVAAASRSDAQQGFSKCAPLLRKALELTGAWDQTAEFALCNTGYEHPDVARYYDGIRELITKGLIEGRGNLTLPAGPRYTERRITADGLEQLGKYESISS